jgi:DNA-binding XRE family transcriptional regulator
VTIHNHVARLRKERGLSRKELADTVGVGSQTIGYVELHDYRILILRTTVVIVQALDAPFWDVFSRELFAAEVGHLESLEAWIVEALAPFREAPACHLARATGLSEGEMRENLSRLENSGHVRTREFTSRQGFLRRRSEPRLFAALSDKAGSDYDGGSRGSSAGPAQRHGPRTRPGLAKTTPERDLSNARVRLFCCVWCSNCGRRIQYARR